MNGKLQFDPVMRLALEQHPDRFGKELLQHIGEIEQAAKRDRENLGELSPKTYTMVDDLKVKTDLARLRYIVEIDGAIQQKKEEWEKARARDSAKRLVEIEEARLKIQSVYDLEQYASDFMNGEIDLSHTEAQILTGCQLAPAVREGVMERIKAERIDEPWLETEGDREVADYRDQLESVKSGAALISGMQVPVDTLIDLNGEMDGEVK